MLKIKAILFRKYWKINLHILIYKPSKGLGLVSSMSKSHNRMHVSMFLSQVMHLWSASFITQHCKFWGLCEVRVHFPPLTGYDMPRKKKWRKQVGGQTGQQLSLNLRRYQNVSPAQDQGLGRPCGSAGTGSLASGSLRPSLLTRGCWADRFTEPTGKCSWAGAALC